MKELNFKIRDAEMKLLMVNEELNDLNVEKESIALMIKSEIAEEVVIETGKPKYSNETKRQAETIYRMGKSKKYMDVIKNIKDIEHEKGLIEIELNFLKREFRYKTILKEPLQVQILK